MATYGYTAPGVRVGEVVTPTVAPIFERPTNIAIVGEALGYEEIKNEIVFLEDNDAVTLRVAGVNASSVVVKDSYDSNTTYAPLTDYVLGVDGDFMTIKRNVYTTIESGERVVIVLTTTGDTSRTRAIGDDLANGVTIEGLQTVTVYAPTADDVETVHVQRQGRFSVANDYDTSVSGTSTAKIRRKSGSPRILDGQKVYVSYTTNEGANLYLDEEHTLTSTTYSSNFQNVAEGVDETSIVVRNAGDLGYANTTAMVEFTNGATSDFTYTFDNGATPTPTITVARAMGPTTIGSAENRRTVKVTYQATSPDYYLPVRCVSYAEVERRYGAAINPTTGQVLSPLTFGAYFAFVNGASDVVTQALFHSSDVSDSQALRTAPSNKAVDTAGYVADWQGSLRSLRDFPDINVIVPIVGQDASLSDTNVRTILTSLQDHIGYMAENDEHIISLNGEDSTTAGSASMSTLQSHAQSLGTHPMASRTVLVSPGAFAFPNGNLPKGYQAVGGQYMAAALAGQLAARPIQDALTRKGVVGFADVLDYRSKEDKNNDAQSGLLVVERRNNAVVVRHAVTTAITDVNSQELSVVRAKLYMMESIRRTLDARIIGQILADENAPTVVGATIQGVLETLVQSQAIVAYSGLQVSAISPSQPSTLKVRFNYKPSFPLNYIDVEFSVDVTTGVSTTFGV